MNRRRTVAVMAAFAVVGALVGALLRPGAGSIDENTPVHGDDELATQTLEHLSTEGMYALSIAEVSPEGTRTATIGAPLDGAFEIGSVSKAITGLLYAEALERGEVHPETTLGQVFQLADAAAGEVTLEGLSQHRSGLPRLPISLTMMVDSYRWLLLGHNPYREEPADVVEDLRSVSVGGDDPSYSNVGYAALGLALAAVAETSYSELVRSRLAEPLGLETFYLPDHGDGAAHPQAVDGRSASGRAQQPWDSAGYAPAGGIRADADSMAGLAQALLSDEAPGASALDPVSDFDESTQIGAGWLTQEHQGREITWHNGQTGGFSTWFGLDRERGTAVFISAASDHPVDDAGRTLLLEAGRSSDD